MAANERAKRPTQTDIARLAGVSRTAVSLVLGGNRSNVTLSADTYERVEAAARKLGYVPNPVATRLAAGRNNLLGVYTFSSVFPTEIGDSYYGFLTGIEQESASAGYDVVLFTASSSPEESPARREMRRVRLTDGVIFLGRHLPVGEISTLLEEGFPLVYIGRQDALGPRLPYVGIDYATASRRVVSMLADLGHRRFLYLREDDDAPSSTDRQDGFLSGVSDRSDEGVQGEVKRLSGDRRVTPDLVSRWVTSGVTAIVVEQEGRNRTLLQLTDAAEKAGVDVPRDLSIAVLGDPTGLPKNAPDYTGFAYPRETVGRLAVQLLNRLLDGDDVPSEELQQLVPCEEMSGETAGPAPAV